MANCVLLFLHLQEFYADICRGPRNLPAPPRPPTLAQLTPADPAGLKYLNDVASWLLRKHVEFANGAHADLTERARQLHDEVRYAARVRFRCSRHGAW
jgi:hypothetical protein